MTLDQLRIFVLVAEHGHMTRAAEAAGLSQSGASAAIKGLEERYGTSLFDRVGRRIELSQAGRRFLPEARAVLDRAAAARLVLENASETISGTVSIAASLTIASYWLPRRLAAFQEAFASVRLDVAVENTRHVEAAVLSGEADIGLVEGRTFSALIHRSRVDIDRMTMVVARDAPPLPEIAPGRPDISRIRWIAREAGSGTREALEDLARRHGLALSDLRVFLVLPSNEAVRQAVEAGAGAAIVSQHVVARSLAEGALRKVPLDIPARDFAMIAHTGRRPGPAQRALRDHLRGDAGRPAVSG